MDETLEARLAQLAALYESLDSLNSAIDEVSGAIKSMLADKHVGFKTEYHSDKGYGVKVSKVNGRRRFYYDKAIADVPPERLDPFRECKINAKKACTALGIRDIPFDDPGPQVVLKAVRP